MGEGREFFVKAPWPSATPCRDDSIHLEVQVISGYDYLMHSALATGVESQNLLTAFAREPRQVFLQGLTPASGAFLLARLFRDLARPFLLVTPNGEGHETFLKDLTFFLGGAVDPDAGAEARHDAISVQ